MDKALLHPLTRQAFGQAAISSHHAFGIIGPYGTGKSYLAKLFAVELLGGQPRPNQVLALNPRGHAIGIDEVREVQSYLKLKTAGQRKTRRIVIINSAESMTIEAQNALLKTLEEPPSDTKIILAINGLSTLRKTIYSRLYIIQVKPCPLNETTDYFKSNGRYSNEEIKRAYTISGGLAGLCHALLNDKEHPLVDAIAKAKEFLSAKYYVRLLSVNDLSKDKDVLRIFLFALQRVLSAAHQAGRAGAPTHESSMRAVHEAQKELALNSNTKLLLTNLALQL